MPVYYRSDLLRLVASLDTLDGSKIDWSVYADIDVTPMFKAELYDGAVHTHDLRISDARGTPVHQVHETFLRDASGRSIGTERDGKRFATYAYDVRGLPDHALFGDPAIAEQSVTFQHDPYTHALTGVNQHSSQWASAISHRMNARGHIEYEHIALPDAKLQRQYQYSPEGYLTHSLDAHNRSVYGYDKLGLPATTTTDVSGLDETRNFSRQGSVLTAGDHHHTFDALGRAIERDDVQVEYSPNGQIRRGQRGDKAWEYLYDEGGIRLAKRVNGELIAGYLEGGSYLDATSLTEPIRVLGVLAGVVKHTGLGTSKFHTIATDPRGTALVDIDGTTRIASPFGDRATRPDVSAALDYASQGYDADLGTVRMGVRDYDPVLGRFLTPDPLMLEDLDACLANSVECNLYGYASGNPLSFTDPNGESATPLDWGFLAADYIKCATWGPNTSTLEKAIDLAAFAFDAISIVTPVPALAGLAVRELHVAEAILSSERVAHTASHVAQEAQAIGHTSAAVAHVASEAGYVAKTAHGADIGKNVERSLENGSFSIIAWKGYPANLPRPEGPFRILEGAELKAARDLANRTNAQIIRAEKLQGSGYHIHEIHPVKFGGSPTDRANKVFIKAEEHIGTGGVHPEFWTPLLKWTISK